MNHEDLSVPTCETVCSWPRLATIKIQPLTSTDGVLISMSIGSFYINAPGLDVYTAIWDLQRRWTAAVSGSCHADDVLAAIRHNDRVGR